MFFILWIWQKEMTKEPLAKVWVDKLQYHFKWIFRLD